MHKKATADSSCSTSDLSQDFAATSPDRRRLSADDVADAIRRVRGRREMLKITYELALRLHREGPLEVDVDFEPDGSCYGSWVYPDDEFREALAAHGHDPETAEAEAAIKEGQEEAEKVASDAIGAGSPFSLDHRQEAAAYRSLHASDSQQYCQPMPRLSAAPLILRRSLRMRRGHERRAACNARSKGSRRGSGSSPPKSGDDDPGSESEGDGPSQAGLLHPVLAGGAR